MNVTVHFSWYFGVNNNNKIPQNNNKKILFMNNVTFITASTTKMYIVYDSYI